MPTAANYSSPIAICAIATRSYEGRAARTLRGFGASLPDARLVLLGTDRSASEVSNDLTTLTADDCVADPRLHAMRKRYSNAELCFALKPFLIRRLLNDGYEQVHYVDADCFAVGGLAPMVGDLSGADLLLTPHNLNPIPADDCSPTALTVLRAGAFNAGYLGVRATAQGREFARWFADMTEQHAYNQPAKGMCGDQRWLDLAPAFFPGLAICRRRGANAGYWNLHERPVTLDESGHYYAGNEPLLFFHFSGFSQARPEQLSCHQNRHALVSGEALQLLVRDYLRHLQAGEQSREQPITGWKALQNFLKRVAP